MSKIHDTDALQEDTLQNTEEISEVEEKIEENKEGVAIGEVSQDESGTPEIARLKELLARTQADYENYTKRTERDKADMLAFMRGDILKKILPRIDDLERMIS